MLAVPSSKPEARATVNTKAIGHTGKMKMTRHGLMPPPRPWRRRKPAAPWPTAASGDSGRQAKHGRALFVDKRAGSRFSVFEAGRCATNSTSTSLDDLDDLDVELVPGLYDIGGHRASREDVWACDVAPGNSQNTQQSIGGRRNNPPC